MPPHGFSCSSLAFHSVIFSSDIAWPIWTKICMNLYIRSPTKIHHFVMILQKQNKAAMGNSCFWLSEHFNIVCQTTVLYNLFHNSNDVCEVLYKDSSYNLVLIQYKRLLNVIYDTKTNISLTLIYLWHKNKHLPHILLRNIPCNSQLNCRIYRQTGQDENNMSSLKGGNIDIVYNHLV